MKIAGKTIKGPNEDFIVIPRPSTIDENGDTVNNDIVFKARAVLDYSDFNSICPVPEPPNIVRRGETVAVKNVEDPEFKKQIQKWGHQKTMWMILKSLQATPDLEFETVKMNDPATFDNILTELKDADFTGSEIDAIINIAIESNTISDEKMKEAKKRFLAGQAVVAEK